MGYDRLKSVAFGLRGAEGFEFGMGLDDMACSGS